MCVAFLIWCCQLVAILTLFQLCSSPLGVNYSGVCMCVKIIFDDFYLNNVDNTAVCAKHDTVFK